MVANCSIEVEREEAED
jgi:SHS2 domain-containing protein